MNPRCRQARFLHLAVFPCWLIAAFWTKAADDGPWVRTGHDFTLPPRVAPADRSGLFYVGAMRLDSTAQTAIGGTCTWAQLNPADGEYDFKIIHDFLDAARRKGRKAVIRVKGLVIRRDLSDPWPGFDAGPYIPQWVLDKHQPAQFVTRSGDGMTIRVAAPWDPGVDAEYRKFVQRFGEAGFFADKTLAGVYVHAFSTSGGEEFWLSGQGPYVRDAEAAGMTESVLNETFRRRMRYWADAAGAERRKLAWIYFIHIQGRAWATEPLNEFALSLGLGWRAGADEDYHRHPPPEMGQVYKDGYVTVDWSHPLRDGRYFGSETEHLVEAAAEVQRHLVRSSFMRAAQLGMNFLWIGSGTLRAAPDMAYWLSRVAGKSPAASPDAVCWLREDYFHPGLLDPSTRDDKVAVWKNFERFLYQRDVAGGYRTRPACRIDRPRLREDAPGYHFDYSARRTDAAGNSRAMLLFLEPAFLATLCAPFALKVTYLDQDRSVWLVETATAAGLAETPPIQNTGTGHWRTATFTIREMPVTGNLPHKAHFRLRVLNDRDVTVRFVRVVRGAS